MKGRIEVVSIVIVNYNTSNVLADCVESVFKFEKPENFEIIIVDNFSKDDSKEVINNLSKKHNNIKSIFLDKLQSFSFANNRGIEIAKGENVIIMNPDIIFTEPLFDKLQKDFENKPDTGAISPALIGTDGKFQRNYFQRYPTIMQFLLFHCWYAKIFFHFPGLMNRWLENQDVDISQKKIWEVEQIPCAFFMTRKKTLEEIGMMDEKFILFFEDVDLSYRISKFSKLEVDTSMQVTHLGGVSFKNENNWWMYGRFIVSMRYFMKKYYGSFRGLVLSIFAVSNSLTVLIVEYLKKIIGKSDEYRIKKHKFTLKLLISDK